MTLQMPTERFVCNCNLHCMCRTFIRFLFLFFLFFIARHVSSTFPSQSRRPGPVRVFYRLFCFIHCYSFMAIRFWTLTNAISIVYNCQRRLTRSYAGRVKREKYPFLEYNCCCVWEAKTHKFDYVMCKIVNCGWTTSNWNLMRVHNAFITRTRPLHGSTIPLRFRQYCIARVIVGLVGVFIENVLPVQVQFR